MVQTLIFSILISILLSVQAFLRPLPPQGAQVLATAKPSLQQNATFIRVLTPKAHLPAVVDGAWIRALQQADLIKDQPKGSETTKNADPLFFTLDVLTDLDPRHFLAYQAGAILLTFMRKDYESAASLLHKGSGYYKSPDFQVAAQSSSRLAQEWTQGYFLYLHLGYLYLFQMHRLPEARDAFLQASQIPGAPFYLKPMAERIGTPDGVYLLGLRFLSATLQRTPSTSESYLELKTKMRSLEVGHYLFKLKQGLKNRETLPPFDPWGGKLTLDPKTLEIRTTTPYEKIYGLGD